MDLEQADKSGFPFHPIQGISSAAVLLDRVLLMNRGYL